MYAHWIHVGKIFILDFSFNINKIKMLVNLRVFAFLFKLYSRINVSVLYITRMKYKFRYCINLIQNIKLSLLTMCDFQYKIAQQLSGWHKIDNKCWWLGTIGTLVNTKKQSCYLFKFLQNIVYMHTYGRSPRLRWGWPAVPTRSISFCTDLSLGQ